MRWFRQLGVSLFVLLALLASSLFGAPLLNNRVEAASTYNYADGGIICAANPAPIAIVERATNNNGSVTTIAWCYASGTTYDFVNGNNKISVSGTTPNQGTLQVNGNTATISNIDDSAGLFARTFPTASGQPTTVNPDEAENCESVGVWAWAACPIISMMTSGIGWLDERIQGLLEVGEDRYTNDKLHSAWINFRNISYAILIPIMLIMVITTALGFDMFSAYTIKKALPRMAVAVIFITMSWYITTFLIGFFNVIGAGILGLMTSPFGIDNGMSLSTLFGASHNDAGDVVSTVGSASVQWAATLGVLGGLAAFVASPGGLVILLFYLVPVVGFILLAFLVLMLREIFILAGVLLAPLAILAWIFPGNDKLWKVWWGGFSKLLMMFPLIMIILGAGRIGAYLIDVSGGGGAQSLVNPLLKLTAYVMPYVFIPMTFRFAGGVFANLAGMVNDREKGFLDRLRKKRGEHLHEYAHRAQGNKIFDQKRAAAAKGFKGWRMRATNTVGGWVFDPVNNAHVALQTEKGRAILSQVNQGKLEDSQKLMEVLSRMGFNAEELSSLSVGRLGKRADGSKYWIKAWDGSGKDLDRIADQLSESSDEQDRIGGQHLRSNAQLLTQVTRSEEYGRADFKVAAGMAYAAQGFATPEEIARMASEADGYKFEAVPVFDSNGNLDKMDFKVKVTPQVPSGMGGIVKTNAELLAARGGGLGKPGYGVRLGADGRYYATTTEQVGTDSAGNIILSGAKIEQIIRTGVQDLSGAKGSQITAQLEDAIRAVMTSKAGTKFVQADGTTKEISAIKTGVEDTLVQVMGSYAAPDVKNRIYRMLVSGRATNYSATMGAAEATARAEREVQALLSRSSGAIDPNKLGMLDLNNDENEKK